MSSSSTRLYSLVVASAMLFAGRVAHGRLGDPAPYHVAAPREPERLPAPRRRPEYLLLVSIDGLSFDAFRRHRRSLRWLDGIARRGTFRPLRSSFPSMTWVAHTSLITGQHARHHGILGNRWSDAGGRYYRPMSDPRVVRRRVARVPSLLELAQQRKLSVASLNWPATQGLASVRWNLPEIYGARSSYRRASKAMRRLFDRYAAALGAPGRDARYRRNLLSRIALKEGVEYDMLLRDLAVRLVKGSSPPKIMLLHFLLPDSWMHRYGPSRLIERWSLELTDRALGRVVAAYRSAGIWDKTAVLVASDHGFAEVTHTMDLRRLLKKEGYSNYLWYNGRRAKKDELVSLFNGHAAFLYARSPRVRGALPALVKLLKGYPGCVERVLGPGAYAALGLPLPARAVDGKPRNPREHPGAPTLVVLAKPHCLFRGGSKRRPVVYELKNGPIGAHGYPPRHRPLRALLVAAGPGLAQRKVALKVADLVDVAPTAAHLLGLRWPKSFPAFPRRAFTLDGRILRDLLAP